MVKVNECYRKSHNHIFVVDGHAKEASNDDTLNSAWLTFKANQQVGHLFLIMLLVNFDLCIFVKGYPRKKLH